MKVQQFVAAAIAALVVACSANAQDTLKLASGQRGNWDTSVSEVGQRAGIFKKHGLMLDILWTQGAGESQQAVLSGSVDITQGDLHLTAARTTVAYTSDGGLKIQRIDATGGVVVTRGNERASGAAGVYDFNRRVIVLAGGVALRRGTDTLNGGRLTIDLKSGLSTVDGGGGRVPGSTSNGGRVSGTFSVPKKST